MRDHVNLNERGQHSNIELKIALPMISFSNVSYGRETHIKNMQSAFYLLLTAN